MDKGWNMVKSGEQYQLEDLVHLDQVKTVQNFFGEKDLVHIDLVNQGAFVGVEDLRTLVTRLNHQLHFPLPINTKREFIRSFIHSQVHK